MTAAGRAKLDPSATAETPPAARAVEVPAFFREALDAEPAAREYFAELAPSYRRSSFDQEAETRRQVIQARHSFVDALLSLEEAVGASLSELRIGG